MCAAVVADRVFPPDFSRAGVLSPELVAADGTVLNLRAAADGAVRLAADPGAVGPDIVPLLIAREDRRFWWHPGVDPAALARAAWQVATRGRIVSGGSTLAMQVARLLEPHARGPLGKLRDIARALQIEARVGREGVLRLYLTLAPMGGNLEGVRAGSLAYFGREPGRLSREQAALLAGLPQSPARRRPDRYPERAWAAAARVLAAAGDADVPPVVAVTRGLPALARHVAQGRAGRTATLLDAGVQARAEALAAREVAWMGPDADIAAIVVRVRDRAVIASVGGTGFFEARGMVDRARAVRSPGSALKPVIYAMAFDEGLALPSTPLSDAALRMGVYAPRDFDRAADRGRMRAADALRASLNRPAVALLAELGPERFAGVLARAGAALSLPAGAAPSAALALGGAAISPAGLASLYADLADGGVTRPLRWAPGDPVAATGAMVGPRAAAMVGAILRDQPPPPGVAADGAHAIAWKTGTSYGFRDAWTAGFSGDYAVVVWAGRRDGAPVPLATGRAVAAPILFRLFALLPPDARAPVAIPDGTDAPRAPMLTAGAAAPLRILFPPGDVELAYDPVEPVALRAAGGRAPYAWTADGVPLAAPLVGEAPAWTAAGPGFSHLTVTDRDGRAASVDVRLVE